MPVYTPGGGGGRSSIFDENPGDALSKPYDVDWPPSADTMQQINEMFDLLFKSMVKRREEIEVLEDAPSADQTLLIKEVSLTTAQMRSANTSPIELLPAVTGYTYLLLEPLYGHRTSTLGFSASPTSNVIYANGGVIGVIGSLISGTGGELFIIANTPADGSTINIVSTGSPASQAVQLKSSSDVTSGDAVATLRIPYMLVENF